MRYARNFHLTITNSLDIRYIFLAMYFETIPWYRRLLPSKPLMIEVQIAAAAVAASRIIIISSSSSNHHHHHHLMCWKANDVSYFSQFIIGYSLSLIGIILRWGFLIWELIFIYCGLFVLILVVFVLFLLSVRFGQISPLAFFRRFAATSDRNAESCNRIPSNYGLP